MVKYYKMKLKRSDSVRCKCIHWFQYNVLMECCDADKSIFCTKFPFSWKCILNIIYNWNEIQFWRFRKLYRATMFSDLKIPRALRQTEVDIQFICAFFENRKINHLPPNRITLNAICRLKCSFAFGGKKSSK